MLQFKKITLADKPIIQQFTLNSQRRNCDLTFANLYSWRFFYQTEYAVAHDALFFRFYEGNELRYMLPVTEHLTREILAAMEEDALRLEQPLIIGGVCADIIPTIEMLMPDQFEFESYRDYADYIYDTESLATLVGKKYQPKRNHINQFKHKYPNYRFTPLTVDLIPNCLDLEEQWAIAHDIKHQRALEMERNSMIRALLAMEALDIEGGVLWVDDKIVAFSYGAQLNQTTFDVCIEKGNTEIEGVYAMINHEMANMLLPKYAYLNREEDLGIEGLRQSKLSYHPSLLLEKYTATLK